MDIPILFEDEMVLVVDKPPGLVVNRAESVKGETVQDWVEKKDKDFFAKWKGENEEFFNRSGVVHRIDKETSGILVIAKTPEAFVELQRQFKERIVKKTYRAIVHGDVVPEEGEIRAPVGRLPWNREHFGIVPGGKEAITKYKKLSIVKKEEPFSLLELYPETGRTHQIRVHLKYINHPILGDYLYAGRKVGRDDRVWVPRVMLHAYKIEFLHPSSGNHIAIEAPIPDDMKRIMEV